MPTAKRTVKKSPDRKAKGSKGRRTSVSLPRSVQTIVGGREPLVVRSSRGCRIQHREFITDVFFPPNATVWTPTVQAINPGLASTFPWLSGVANQYEMYAISSMNFEFMTRSGTGTDGMMAMVVDYDAADPPPESKAKMFAYDHCITGPIWHDLVLPLDSRKAHLGMPQRYTRKGVQTDIDLKTYDTGNLYVATLSPTRTYDGKFIGELWVSYTIELFIPQLRAEANEGAVEGGQKYGNRALLPPDITVTGAPPVVVSTDGTTTRLTFTQPWEGTISYAATKGVGTGVAVLPGMVAAAASPASVPLEITPLQGFSTSAPIFTSVQEWAVKAGAKAILEGSFPVGSLVDLAKGGFKFAPLAYAIAKQRYEL